MSWSTSLSRLKPKKTCRNESRKKTRSPRKETTQCARLGLTPTRLTRSSLCLMSSKTFSGKTSVCSPTTKTSHSLKAAQLKTCRTNSALSLRTTSRATSGLKTGSTRTCSLEFSSLSRAPSLCTASRSLTTSRSALCSRICFQLQTAHDASCHRMACVTRLVAICRR